MASTDGGATMMNQSLLGRSNRSPSPSAKKWIWEASKYRSSASKDSDKHPGVSVSVSIQAILLIIFTLGKIIWSMGTRIYKRYTTESGTSSLHIGVGGNIVMMEIGII
ncbi:uncharacterized protein LOC144561457 [Carex rostrata]